MKTTNVRTSVGPRRSHVRLALVTALCVATFVACGGSDDSLSGLSCGSGTHEEGGACVSDGSAGAGGASAGGAGTSGAAGQSAGAAGTGGASGGAGTSGSGGTMAAGGAGSAGTSAGGAPGGSGGAPGGAAGAAGWGPPHPGDNPCPGQLDVNCSDSCGPMHPLCKDPKVTCVDAPNGVLPSPIEMPFNPFFSGTQKVVLRLPSHPGVDPKCPTCTKENPVYGVSVSVSPKLVTLTNESRFFKISMEDDTWRMSRSPEQPFCHPLGWFSCSSFEISPSFPEAETAYFSVPSGGAPARNVVFEMSKQKLSCP